jgi:hypothetical protein
MRVFVAFDTSVCENLRRRSALVEIGLRFGQRGTKQRNQTNDGGETPSHAKLLDSLQKPIASSNAPCKALKLRSRRLFTPKTEQK